MLPHPASYPATPQLLALQKENEQLRELVIRLSEIVARNVVGGQRQGDRMRYTPARPKLRHKVRFD